MKFTSRNLILGFSSRLIPSAMIFLGLHSGVLRAGSNVPQESAPSAIIEIKNASSDPSKDLLLTLPGRQGNEVHSYLLTLSHALDAAIKNSEVIKAAKIGIEAAHASFNRSTLLLNPSIEYETERLKGRSNTSSTDSTIAIAQPIELGGKRSRREDISKIEASIAEQLLATKQVELINEVTKIYIECRSNQDRLDLAISKDHLAEEMMKTTQTHLKIGGGSLLDEAKLKASRISFQIERKRTSRALELAKLKLLDLMRESIEPSFQVEGSIFKTLDINPPPNWSLLASELNNSLTVKSLDTLHKLRSAQLELEKSKQIPDVTLKGGIRSANEGREKGYIAGISLQLPLFDRNQWSVREGQLNLEKTRSDNNAATLAIMTNLRAAFNEYVTSCEEATELKDQAIPQLQRAFDLAMTGFKQGRFSFLEVLDAQRALYESKGQLIASYESCKKSESEISTLVQTDSNHSAENIHEVTK